MDYILDLGMDEELWKEVCLLVGGDALKDINVQREGDNALRVAEVAWPIYCDVVGKP